MTTLNQDQVKKIAHLARLNMSQEEMAIYTPQLINILNFVEQMNAKDTTAVEALAHPYEMNQRLREDAITEQNQRDLFQSIAPQTEAGLYLVPQVIEGE